MYLTTAGLGEPPPPGLYDQLTAKGHADGRAAARQTGSADLLVYANMWLFSRLSQLIAKFDSRHPDFPKLAEWRREYLDWWNKYDQPTSDIILRTWAVIDELPDDLREARIPEIRRLANEHLERRRRVVKLKADGAKRDAEYRAIVASMAAIERERSALGARRDRSRRQVQLTKAEFASLYDRITTVAARLEPLIAAEENDRRTLAPSDQCRLCTQP